MLIAWLSIQVQNVRSSGAQDGQAGIGTCGLGQSK
jgi:hypothetical protein